MRILFGPPFGLVISILLGTAVWASPTPAGEKKKAIPRGESSFEFSDAKGNAGRPLTVWTWRPEKITPDSPILFVMHGKGRNGRAYRATWVAYAERHNALLLVPEFGEFHYPGSKWYQLGNVEASEHLSPHEILDWARLRRQFSSAAAAEDGCSAGLRRAWARLEAEQRKQLPKALRASKPTDQDRKLILGALNALLEDEKLYDPKAFPSPPPDALAILKWRRKQKKKTGKDPLRGSILRRLNRSLLSSALPGCLRAMPSGRNPRAKWTYLIVERLFDHVRKLTGSKRTTYLIYGHSAGAQFVHRLVMLVPEARYERAVSANSGKYLWPSLAIPYPYGLGGVSNRRDNTLHRALRRHLLVMVGTKDIADDEKKDPDLPTSEQARKQGKNRLIRARNYHKAAVGAARGLDVKLAWTIHEVKDVAHNNAGMAPRAAELLFGPAR